MRVRDAVSARAVRKTLYTVTQMQLPYSSLKRVNGRGRVRGGRWWRSLLLAVLEVSTLWW